MLKIAPHFPFPERAQLHEMLRAMYTKYTCPREGQGALCEDG